MANFCMFYQVNLTGLGYFNGNDIDIAYFYSDIGLKPKMSSSE